jgi:hypothetical protein
VACARSGTAVGGFNEAAHCESHLGYRSPDGALGGKALAQFGWLFPGFNPQQYPQQQYFPRAPGYAPRGSDAYQPRRSRSYAPPPRHTRSYVEPRRPRRSEAKARARLTPAAPKLEVAEVDPNTHIAVFGDRLANLVREGLEEAYDEVDDILVVRDAFRQRSSRRCH